MRARARRLRRRKAPAMMAGNEAAFSIPAKFCDPVTGSQNFAGIENAASLPAIIAGAFLRLNLRARARMLGRLLASVGPLALAVVGGGAFAKYVIHARLPEIPVSFEDAALATSNQIAEI